MPSQSFVILLVTQLKECICVYIAAGLKTFFTCVSVSTSVAVSLSTDSLTRAPYAVESFWESVLMRVFDLLERTNFFTLNFLCSSWRFSCRPGRVICPECYFMYSDWNHFETFKCPSGFSVLNALFQFYIHGNVITKALNTSNSFQFTFIMLFVRKETDKNNFILRFTLLRISQGVRKEL